MVVLKQTIINQFRVKWLIRTQLLYIQMPLYSWNKVVIAFLISIPRWAIMQFQYLKYLVLRKPDMPRYQQNHHCKPNVTLLELNNKWPQVTSFL